MRSAAGALTLALVLWVAFPGGARGQLLSPGKLARPHQALEGLRNCTSCHQLGKSGVQAELCLTCHRALKERVDAKAGFHATVSSACADCHKEHLGEDFNLVRLDEGSFDHSRTGYALEKSHAGVQCRSCHEPSHIKDPQALALGDDPGALSRTFLGLSTECASCHAADNPHGKQFAGQSCATCHDEGKWETPTAFDHGTTDFPLAGRHTSVACSGCHGKGSKARFSPLPHGACNECHADPHDGAMKGACANCHNTSGWQSLRRGGLGAGFDHSRTSFPLRGGHASLDCAACHRTGRPPSSDLVRISYRPGTAGSAYPIPVATTCASCHVDRHADSRSAGRWTKCADCHSEVGWAPSSFGAARHVATGFPLTGAHVTTACVACHQGASGGGTRFVLAVGGRACVDCHEQDSPHGDRYKGLQCESCHTTDAFEDATFDHALLQPNERCASCHQDDNPHGGQFEGRDCSSCHVTDRFTIDRFDHSATRFPLDGAHANTACAQCHVTESSGGKQIVRYRPLGIECTDCHGGNHDR
jgi:hypothetical protein